jgi:hypothetical protein
MDFDKSPYFKMFHFKEEPNEDRILPLMTALTLQFLLAPHKAAAKVVDMCFVPPFSGLK